MLTASEITQLRSDIMITLIDTCTVMSVTRATDDAGNVSESYTDAGMVPCRLDPIKQKDGDGMVAAAERATIYYQLTLTWDAAVVHGQRIVHGGRTYEIIQMHDDQSARIVKRAVVAYIEGT